MSTSVIFPPRHSLDVVDVHPLTPAQEGLLFHWLSERRNRAYLPRFVYSLEGAIDERALEDAWRRIVRRHPVLRSAFVWEDVDHPVQVVLRDVDFRIEPHELGHLTKAEQEKQIGDYLEEVERTAQISVPPLLRVAHFRLAPDRHRLVLSFPHVLLDGWSLAIVLKEALALYEAGVTQTSVELGLPPRFGDFVAWQRAQSATDAESFWRSLLGDAKTTPLLEAVGATLASGGGKGLVKRALGRDLADRIDTRARGLRVTLGTIFNAAWALLLARYSQTDDVLFGVTVSGRAGQWPGVEEVVGLCINTIPMRIGVNERARIDDWLAASHRLATQCRAFEHTPLTSMRGWTSIPPGSPLFDSIVVLENYPVDSTAAEGPASLRVVDLVSVDETHYALTLGIARLPDGRIALELRYDRSRIAPARAEDIASQYVHLLGELTVPERQTLADLTLYPGGPVRGPRATRTGFVHGHISRVARARPERIAVVAGEARLTYGELERRSSALAATLRRRGIERESKVGIHLERSLELVVALLAVLKAGAAYVPLEPAWPARRLSTIASQAKLSVIITGAGETPAALADYDRLVVGGEQEGVAEEPASAADDDLFPSNTAYVLYTSGSSGQPKGVHVDHRALDNHMQWMLENGLVCEGDVVLQKTPFGFDASIWEFFAPLMAGARLFMAPPGADRDPEQLLELVLEHGITVLQVVPTMLRALVGREEFARCRSLRKLFAGGEALSPDLVERVSCLESCRFYNLYGPTETCIDATWWTARPTEDGIVPIGAPIANTELLVLDRDLRALPCGVAGELFIAGDGVARGYLDDPALTAASFVPHPYGREGERAYRTGDRGRIREDGLVEYLGRLDRQIKLRGYRIEIGEIEAALRERNGVRDAVVVFDERGGQRLVAYWTAWPGVMTTGLELRESLKEGLPDYMVPSDVIRLDSLPLGPTGKIDRKALPTPAERRTERASGAPRTPTEFELMQTIRDVLAVDAIGRGSDFFALGGHSLQATQVVSRIRRRFGVEFTVRDLFEGGSIGQLGRLLDARVMAQKGAVVDIGAREYESALAYWETILADLPRLDLPTTSANGRSPRPLLADDTTPRGGCPLVVGDALVEALDRIAAEAGAETSVALVAGVHLLLCRYTGQTDIAVEQVIDGSDRVVVRTNLGDDPDVAAAIRRVREAVFGAYAHRVRPTRDRGKPLQVTVAIQDDSDDGAPPQRHEGFSPGTGELAFVLSKSDRRFIGTMQYDRDRFESRTMERMARHYVRVLAAMVDQPRQRVSLLPLVDPEERAEILRFVTSPTASGPIDRASKPGGLAQEFVERSTLRPAAIAVRHLAEAVSYGEIDRRANHLAHRLRGGGVDQETHVAICLESPVDRMVAMLAVWKAGGACIPIDPTLPSARVASIVLHAAPAVSIVDRHRLGTSSLCGMILDSDAARPPATDAPCELAPAATALESLACITFDGTSLDEPQANLWTHASVLRRLGLLGPTTPDQDEVWQRWVTSCFEWDGASAWAGPTEPPWYVLDGELELVPPGAIGELYAGGEATPRGYLGRPDLTAMDFVPNPFGPGRLQRTGHLARRLASERVEDRGFRGRTIQVNGRRVDLSRVESALEKHDAVRRAAVVRVGDGYAAFVAADLARGLPAELVERATRDHLDAKRSFFDRVYAHPRADAGDRAHAAELQALGVRPGARVVEIGCGDGSRLLHLAPTCSSYVAIDISGHVVAAVEDRIRGRQDLAHVQVFVREAADWPDLADRVDAVIISSAARHFPSVHYLVDVLQQATAAVADGGIIVLANVRKAPSTGLVDDDELVVREEFFLAIGRLLPRIRTAECRPKPAPPGDVAAEDRYDVVLRVGSREDRASPSPAGPGRRPMAALDTLANLPTAARLRELLTVELCGWLGRWLPKDALPSSVHVRKTLPLLPDGAVDRRALAPPDGQARDSGRPDLAVSGRCPTIADGPAPLSYAQQRLWVLGQLGDGAAAYKIISKLRLVGELDVDALQRAVVDVVTRHEPLRTVISLQDGEARQIVGEPTARLETLDVEQAGQTERYRVADRLATEFVSAPFDLARGPLLRMLLLRFSPSEHWLVTVLHHIVADGWSMSIFSRELTAYYRAHHSGAATSLPDLPIRYRDYAAWQRVRMEDPAARVDLDYWRGQLADLPAGIDLPTDAAYPAEPTYAGAAVQTLLDRTLVDGLDSLCSREGATLYMGLLSAFAVLLHRWTGERDFAIGTPIANRPLPELEQLVGLFVNTLPLRASLRGRDTFVEVLGRTRQVALDAYAHQDVPFDRLVSELDSSRSNGRAPIVQVMFAFQNAPAPALSLPNITVQPFPFDLGLTKFELVLTVEVHPNGLGCTFEYNRDLFERSTIEGLARRFGLLLGQVVKDPLKAIGTLPLFTDEERPPTRSSKDATPPTALIHEEIDAVARRMPERAAVIADGRSHSYGELASASNRLARYLVARGIGPDDRVAVRMGRSWGLVVTLLAVWKAGAAYVPLDPAYPEARFLAIVADARPALVLADARPSGDADRTVTWEEAWSAAQAEDDTCPERSVHPGNAAYVLYTSGSTGSAKGVVVEHRALANHMRWMLEAELIEQDDVVLQKTSIGFDASVWEFWAPLMAGGRLAMARPEIEKDPRTLIEELRTQRATVVQVVPSMLHWLVRDDKLGELVDLKKVFAGGEALNADDVARLHETLAVAVFNLYGPTEACIDATFWRCTPGDPQVPIGWAISNTRVYVMNEELLEEGFGVTGEICISGEGLSRGYLGRGDWTAERFVPDPYEVGGRMYLTGDLGRRRRDGSLEYRGRRDDQVKVRGYRIELGEVESVLGELEGIAESAVVVSEAGGGKRLVGYYAVRGGLELSREEIVGRIRERLPEYMVPSVLVELERLPRLSNGKVDRRGLSLRRVELQAREHEPLQGEVQELLGRIWREVLKVEGVGRQDSFFALGGDSILSIQVSSRAREEGWEISAKEVLKEETLERLSRVARRLSAERGSGEVEAVGEPGESVAGAIQRWFFEQELAEPQHFNMSVLLEVRGEVDVGALERAAAWLRSEHEALRYRFRQEGSEWLQEAVSEEEEEAVVLERVQLEARTPAEWSSQLEEVGQSRQRSLDYERGLVQRLTWVSGIGGHRLLWVIHHLVVDGVSWRILLEDLQRAYERERAGGSKRARGSGSFARWCVHADEYAQSEELGKEASYWLRWEGEASKERGRQRLLKGTEGGGGTVSVSRRLDEKTTEALLREVPVRHRVRHQEALLGLVAQSLCEWQDTEHVLIEVEGHGREELGGRAPSERTVGWLTTLYPVWLRVEKGAGLARVLGQVKEQLREIPNNGIGWGLLRYCRRDAELRRRLQSLPRPEVSFEYLGQFEQLLDEQAPFRLAPESSGDQRSPRNKRPYPLSITALVAGGVLEIVWTHDAAIDPTAVERMADRFVDAAVRLVREPMHPYRFFGATDFPAAIEALPPDASARLFAELERRHPEPVLEDIYPLTPAQRGILFHALDREAPTAYCPAFAFEAEGPLCTDRLREALQHLLDRHEPLRSEFVWDTGDVPLAVVRRHAAIDFELADHHEASPDARSAAIDRELRAQVERGFDLRVAPAFRAKVLRFGEHHSCVVLAFHHLILDGWSIPVLLGELVECYRAFGRGEQPSLPPAPRFGDFVRLQARRSMTPAIAYWRQRLAGFARRSTLAAAIGARTGQRGFGSVSLELSADETQTLQDFARRSGLTVGSVVQGAWALLVSRITGEHDVVFGTAVSGRAVELPDIARLVGMCINTVPTRVIIDEAASLQMTLGRIQAEAIAARSHEHVPQSELTGATRLDPGEPLFDTIVVVENYPTRGVDTELDLGVRLTGSKAIDDSNYPLMLVVSPGSRFTFTLKYDQARFSETACRQLVDRYEVVLRAIMARPDARPDELEILTAADRASIEAMVDRRDVSNLGASGVLELVAARANERPDAIAVRAGEVSLTYAELERRAAAVACALQRRGVGRERRVAVCLRRSAELVVALLAVWKAGGAYVPIDPAYPEERVRFMLSDSGACCVVAEEATLANLPSDGPPTFLMEELASTESVFAAPPTIPGQLAYVIYTSGSTGRPKGVAITHANAVAFLEKLPAIFGSERLSSAIFSTSICFDVSVFELWGTLSLGGCVTIVENALDVRGLGDSSPSLFSLVPSAMKSLLDGPPLPSGIATIALAGEAMDGELVQRILVNSRASAVYNLYGPTEYTTYASFARLDPGAGPATIGRPIEGTRILVLDAAGRPLPPGVTGELFIGGPGLARCYWDRPDLTADRFVPDAFGSSGERLYRTGDRGRYRTDGSLEFCGRADGQVKVRGYRIELGEIEAHLRAQSGVRDAVVVADGQALTGYFVRQNGVTDVTSEVLRTALERALPGPLVPSRWIELDALPVGPSGKVDRGALARASAVGAPAAISAPRSIAELRLARILREVTGRTDMPLDATFLQIGGHSLLAMQVVSRLSRELGIELPIRSVFDAPSIAGLASIVDAAARRAQTDPIVPVARDGAVRASFAQARLWILDHIEPGQTAYNIQLALRLRGALRPDALDRALQTIVARHEALRTRFECPATTPLQLVDPPPGPFLRVVDLSGTDPVDADAEIARRRRMDTRLPFALDSDPLIRATLLRRDPRDAVLLVTFHHIAADGWSIGVFLDELARLYDAYGSGRSNPLPPLAIQYADYAAWQRRWLTSERLRTQLDAWRAKLADLPPALELPTDCARPATQTFAGDIVTFEVPRHLADRVHLLAAEQGVTLFMALLAVLKTFLYRCAGSADIVVGTPIANRPRPELEPLIGFFVNTLVLRTSLGGRPTFSEVLSRVRETALFAFEHQDVPFEVLVDELKPPRDLGRTPFFQVMFALQGKEPDAMACGDVSATALEPISTTAKFDLTLFVRESSEGFACSWEYNTDLFDRRTIEEFGERFCRLLDAATERPDVPVGELSVLTARERRTLTDANASTAAPFTPACVHELVRARALEVPDALAVTHGADSLLYRDLENESNQLAHELRRRGVGPEMRVGICALRSPQMLVAMLATWKAGAAYVPLDPAYPPERLAYMAEDASVRLVITDEGSRSRLAQRWGGPLLSLDEPIWRSEPRTPPPVRGCADDLAYVIYTSGSTGRPKGVAITHRNAAHFIAWSQRCFTPSALKRVAATTSICFDLSIFELWVPLVAGSEVVLLDSAADLANLPSSTSLTLINTVPSALAAVVEHLPASVEVIALAGEALKRTLVRDIEHRHSGSQIWNLYGPTEYTTYATGTIVGGGDGEPTIGCAISNTRVYVMNEELLEEGFGVTGEICISGEGLSRGYLGRGDWTAERFVPDPYEVGGRMYLTGDLGRRRRDGSLEYRGRRDDQVKVRGYRIELGEVESVLGELEGIAESAVVVSEAGGVKRLVGYYAVRGGLELSREEIVGRIRERLPEYMVPSVLVELERLPRLSNGKVDRRGLSLRRVELQAREHEPLQGEVQELLGRIWREVLKVEGVGRQDSFFALGGDSILSIQVSSRAREEGWEISAKEVLKEETLERLSRVARRLSAERGSGEVEAVGEPGESVAGAIQRWFFEQELAEPQHFNMSVLLEVRGEVDVGALERAAAWLRSEHEALRYRFRQEGSEWLQEAVSEEEEEAVVLERVQLEARTPAEWSSQLEEVGQSRQRSLDYERGLVQRLTWVSGIGGHRLLWVIHHLVVDGVSWRILLEDLQRAYERERAGGSKRARGSGSFARWCVHADEYAQSEELGKEASYWLRWEGEASKERGRQRLLKGTEGGGGTVSVSRRLDEKTTEALLREVPVRHRVRHQEALLGLVAQSLCEWQDTEHVLIEVEGHGREELGGRAPSERTVGWLTTLYPVWLRVEKGAGLARVLGQVKEQLREIPNNGIGWGLLRYCRRDAELRRRLQSLPRPEVSFEYLGQFEQLLDEQAPFRLAPESSGDQRSPRNKRPYPLSITALVAGGVLSITFAADVDPDAPQLLGFLADRFCALANELAAGSAREVAEAVRGDFPDFDVDDEALVQAISRVGTRKVAK